MQTIKHQKPATLYPRFVRKSAEPDNDVSHYCPGCGHGVVHNLIAEAIQDFGIQDRTIFCSPVGCSVFAYYYFDTGNIQCAHGRAPAAASAIRRTRHDAIVISYQGDGDLAGIGLSHIIHAANRGENITVFFINNAIYGMTGGQLAPTTPIGLRTPTTPLGRDPHNDGYPLGMCEIISQLHAPVLVERVSLANGTKVVRARKVIREALQNQIDGRGFSFVEILSPCPVGWKMSPVEARVWMEEQFEKVFPPGNFRRAAIEVAVPNKPARELPPARVLEILGIDPAPEPEREARPIMPQHIKIAGFGGQGVVSGGILLAHCALEEGFQTTWIPSYGPEMRGGTANSSINISNEVIGSPAVTRPNVLIACNIPSLDNFESQVEPGGLVIVNSSLISRKVERSDVRAVYLPASDMANSIGERAVLNVILLAAYAALTGVIRLETLRRVVPATLKKQSAVDANLRAIDEAVTFITAHYPQS
jgi:2-oxoisovalerate ferredoxin oxidoreductase beta subunit